MKLGAQGFIAYERFKSGGFSSQSFPALVVNPLDVSGAGDSLLAIMSIGLSSGEEMMPTAAIGCCMAALAVGTMGNNAISKASLEEALIDFMRIN